MRAATLAITLALAALVGACAPSRGFAADRARDLGDVVHVHVMAGRGLGAKLEATRWVHLGYDNYYADAAGWTGRRLAVWSETIFGWGVVLGEHREALVGLERLSGSYGSWPGTPPPRPVLDALALRGRLFLFFGADLELRLGEVLDLLAGLAGFDPSGDDRARDGAGAAAHGR